MILLINSVIQHNKLGMYFLISSRDNYIVKGQWVGASTMGENCSTSEALFEYIAAKPEDLIESINYTFFDHKIPSTNMAKFPNDFWSFTDTKQYGRCFTAVPNRTMIKYGIQSITMRVWATVDLFFHTTGMLQTSKQPTLLEK